MKKKAFTFVMCVVAVLVMSSMAMAAIGDWVIITVPLAPTFGYANATRTDEDDEMMYGMVGEITATGTSTVPGTNLGVMYLVNTQYEYPDGYLRRDSGEYDLVSKEEALAWRDAQTHWVISSFADVLPEKDLNVYPPLITLYKGALLRQTAPEDAAGWIEVTLRSGEKGYVRSECLRERKTRGDLNITKDIKDILSWTPEETEKVQAQIAADAISYTNANYRWAGKTPLGLDCSGLASMAYMLNEINSYRNSRPEPGNAAIGKYPIAVKHIDTPANSAVTFTTGSTHTLESLKKAKPGDFLYWSGHQGVYIGDGKFVHANGSSASNRMNSLIPGQSEPAPTRTDLNTYGSIYTWGTAFPDEPGKIIIDRLAMTRTAARTYRIWVRMNGYVPNKVEFYPCGVDASGNPLGYDGTTASPVVETNFTTANIRYLVFDSITNTSARTFVYGADAVDQTYRPAIKLINDAGWRPNGVDRIESEIFIMPTNLTVN